MTLVSTKNQSLKQNCHQILLLSNDDNDLRQELIFCANNNGGIKMEVILISLKVKTCLTPTSQGEL